MQSEVCSSSRNNSEDSEVSNDTCDGDTSDDDTSDDDDAMMILQNISNIDAKLESKAYKNNLNKRNIKSILKHVVSNEHVLTMVRNTMLAENEDHADLEEAEFVPKLTRSRANDLNGKEQYVLSDELPENESSSDEEYQPSTEAESDSEDESKVSCDPPSTSLVDLGANGLNEENVTELPDQTENAAAEPCNQVPEVALRTRSKLSLTDTLLEELEAQFVSPDIAEDMYDTECYDEDWITFLSNLTKPIDGEKTVDNEPNDDDDDPDYNFLEEEENIPEDLKQVDEEWDNRKDRAVKVTKKELRDLMAEIEQSVRADESYNEQSNEVASSACVSWTPAEDRFFNPKNFFELLSYGITEEEKLQIQEQMRMHVQLLCQMYLLSTDKCSLKECGETAKEMLEELATFSEHNELQNGRESFFNAYNLFNALNIIRSVPPCKDPSKALCVRKKARISYGIHDVEIKRIIATDKAFIYPSLLPAGGLQSRFPYVTKLVFFPAEDNLIALGLEQFSSFSPSTNRDSLISSYLVPTKTVEQIRTRYRRMRSSKGNPGNPILYYFLHQEAPPFPRSVQPFDPSEVKCMFEVSHDLLPLWLVKFLNSRPNLNSAAAKSNSILPQSKGCRPFRKYNKEQQNLLGNKYKYRDGHSTGHEIIQSPLLLDQKPKRKRDSLSQIVQSDNRSVCRNTHGHKRKKIITKEIYYSAKELSPSKSTGDSDNDKRLPTNQSSDSDGPLSKRVCTRYRHKKFRSPHKSVVQKKSSESTDQEDNYSLEGSSACSENDDDQLPKTRTTCSGNLDRYLGLYNKPERRKTIKAKFSWNKTPVRLKSQVTDQACNSARKSSHSVSSEPEPGTRSVKAQRRRPRKSSQRVNPQPENHPLKANPVQRKTKVTSQACNSAGKSSHSVSSEPEPGTRSVKAQRMRPRKSSQHEDPQPENHPLRADPVQVKSEVTSQTEEKDFAESYLRKVFEALKMEQNKWNRFLTTLCAFEDSTQPYNYLFGEVKNILSGHPDLIEDFSFFIPGKEPG